jgi:hypothetical protein
MARDRTADLKVETNHADAEARLPLLGKQTVSLTHLTLTQKQP